MTPGVPLCGTPSWDVGPGKVEPRTLGNEDLQEKTKETRESSMYSRIKYIHASVTQDGIMSLFRIKKTLAVTIRDSNCGSHTVLKTDHNLFQRNKRMYTIFLTNSQTQRHECDGTKIGQLNSLDRILGWETQTPSFKPRKDNFPSKSE